MSGKLCKCLQGVLKVRSSNFMHYNFWSKLYFYMKFLEDVYFSTKYMYSEFQWLAHPLFFITFCSRCGMNWNTVCRPTDDPFCAFLSPGAQEPVQPPNNICLVYAAEKKCFLGIHPKKIIIPPPFGTARLLYFFTNLRRAGLYLAGRLYAEASFLPSQGPLILNILNSFSWAFLDSAC